MKGISNDDIPFILFVFIVVVVFLDLYKIPAYICKKFKKHIKQHKMINTKILLKAMSFMFLPTLAVLCIIFCWFFSWTAFSSFITSQSSGAALLRIIMMVLEVVLCYMMYGHYMLQYEEEEKKKQIKKFVLNPDAESEAYREAGYSNYIRDIFKVPEGRASYKYYVVDGPTDDLVFIKRTQV